MSFNSSQIGIPSGKSDCDQERDGASTLGEKRCIDQNPDGIGRAPSPNEAHQR